MSRIARTFTYERANARFVNDETVARQIVVDACTALKQGPRLSSFWNSLLRSKPSSRRRF